MHIYIFLMFSFTKEIFNGKQFFWEKPNKIYQTREVYVRINRELGGVFRDLSNIYDGAFLRKYYLRKSIFVWNFEMFEIVWAGSFVAR